MGARSQLICLWSGYAFFPVYLIGFILFAGFIPTLPANWEAAQLAAFFEQNQRGILIGHSICVIASACLIPWSVAIFGQMSRIETGFRAFGYVQLTAGAMGAAFFMIPSFMWAAMAFRNGHSPDTLLILDDFAWVAWIISWPAFAVQVIAIGLCVLMGKAEQQIIPRWAAYVSFWFAVSLLPASLTVFFKTGPFSWNGLIAVYIPLGLYVVWFHSMLFVLLKSIKGQALQPETPQAGTQAAY